MKPTILIASGSSGWGHIKAAHNIASAIHGFAVDWNVECIDVFSYLPTALRYLYLWLWRFASCHIDDAYTRVYRKFTVGEPLGMFRRAFCNSIARVLEEEYKGKKLYAYVATHSLAAAVGSILKERVGCRLGVVATDFVLHSQQVFKNVDFYCVPPIYETLVAPERISLLDGKLHRTGIPIGPEFALKKDHENIASRLGFGRSRITVLFSFGGSGLRANRYIGLFKELFSLQIPIRFVVLTGQNSRFASLLRASYSGSQYSKDMKIFGYMEDVSDLYAAADLFLGKAGGLSISEALAIGLPIGLIDALPGQESYNVDVITRHGVGRYLRNTWEVAEWISALGKTTPNRGGQSLSVAKPWSSIEVASGIYRVVQGQPFGKGYMRREE